MRCRSDAMFIGYLDGQDWAQEHRETARDRYEGSFRGQAKAWIRLNRSEQEREEEKVGIFSEHASRMIHLVLDRLQTR